jgi:serine/threonine-protein kinase
MTAGSSPNRLGKYRLVAELARGGMGIVYLATSEGVGGFQRIVVIKELKPDLAEEPTFLSMFLDEARLAARLHHPNIVQTNEVGQEDGRYFMAMEYLEGRTLQRVVRRGKELGDRSFSRAMYLRVVCDVLSALEYAHNLQDYTGTALEIVHRDVNPQNVFLTYDGQVKVVDFGIAKTADQTEETQAGVLKGKVSYMAPEQATGMHPDRRADVYSVGVMLAEAMTGERLWGKSGDVEILTRLVRNEIPDPGARNPELPPELLRICRRAMSHAREERYPSAAALLQDLEAYIEASGEKATNREIGRLVSDRFASERAQMRNMVEDHMTAAKDSSRLVPTLAMSNPAAASLSGIAGVNEGSVSGGSNGRTSGARSFRGVSSTTPGVASGGNRSPYLLAGVGILLGGAVVAAIAFGLRSPRAQDAEASKAVASVPVVAIPTATATVAPSASAPSTNTVNVRIRVSPPTATLSIDGASVPGNPYVGTFPKGTAVHSLRAIAPGYLPKAEDLTFEDDTAVDLSLERQPQVVYRRGQPVSQPQATPVSAPAPAPAPAPPPAQTPDINPNGGHAPRRTIDPNNPYGTPP